MEPGVGLGDPSGSIPTRDIPRFCDFLIMKVLPESTGLMSFRYFLPALRTHCLSVEINLLYEYFGLIQIARV